MIRYVVIGVIAVVVILLCVCFSIANFSGENYFVNLDKARRIRNSAGFSTYDFVLELNKRHFSNKLKLARARRYEDHYSHGVVALSDETVSSDSLASIATIAHEIGHARQDFRGNKLEKLYRLRKIGKVFSVFVFPLMMIGTVLGALYAFGVLSEVVFLYVSIALVAVGLLGFFFVIFEKYKEIQIEKEASKFAIVYLREYLSEEEILLCKEFLDSARLTYWADLFKNLLAWTFLTKKNKD